MDISKSLVFQKLHINFVIQISGFQTPEIPLQSKEKFSFSQN